MARVALVCAVGLLCLLSLVHLSDSAASRADKNLIVHWARNFYRVVQQTRTIGPVRPGPTTVSRSGSILFSCIYDAWVAFSPRGSPYTGETLDHSVSRTNAHIEEAISYAAHHALTYLYGRTDPALQSFIDNQLSSTGYTLDKVGERSLRSAAGVGIEACHHVVKNRDNDGSNPVGNQPTGPQRPFADYTNYAPVNDPFPEFAKTDCSKVKDIDKWQPPLVKSANGSLVVQLWTDVVFTNMQPFGMISPLEFRVEPPSRNNTRTQAEWYRKWEEIVKAFETLDDLKKTIQFYWAEGPDNLSPTGLLMSMFTNSVELSGIDLEKSVKGHFIIAHAQLDAMIAQYSNKRYWDPPRPTTPIQCIYKGQTLQSWLGPYKGVGPIDGSDWRAYLPDTVVQNPTPEYPCGHCTISGAWNAVSQYFFGEKFIGKSYTMPEGGLPLEAKITDPSNPKYVQGLTDVPNRGPRTQGYAPAKPVTLTWRTFEEAGAQVGDARVFMGVHTYESWRVASALGKRVGARVIEKAERIFRGRKFKITHDLLP